MEYIVGINKQFLGTQHYIETTVPSSEHQLDTLRAAWTILEPHFAEWTVSVTNEASDNARRQFHINDTGTTYIVGINDQFRGYTKFTQCILEKPIDDYHEILSRAWEKLGPQLDAWRQDITNGKIVEGTYFQLENGQPVLE
jgi:hypothetical protein